jgi:DNA-binding MarR family transcriptional regulator
VQGSSESTRDDSSRIAIEEVLDAAIAASRALIGLAARSLGDGDEDVTLPQYRMLVVLGTRGPQPAATLAAALGVSAPTATRMCDRLVRKRLVERQANPSDRRQVVLGLTDAGQELVETVTQRRRREVAALLKDVPSDRLASLIEAFRLFAAAAGELPQADWAAGWNL